MDKSKRVKEKVIQEIRAKAQEQLKLCEEAEKGNISVEEFERRISKAKAVTKY